MARRTDAELAAERQRGYRDYQDGEPYYCVTCGLGFQEVMACEDGICEMETKDAAMARFRPVPPPPVQVGDYSDITEEKL